MGVAYYADKADLQVNGFIHLEQNMLRRICIPLAVFILISLPSCAPTGQDLVPAPSRKIGQNGLLLRELWRKGGVRIPEHIMFAGIIASDKSVAFFDLGTSGTNNDLRVLNAATGQLQWQVANIPPEFSLAMDQDRVYIAVNWYIAAYDLSNGKPLWRTPENLPGHTGYWLYPMGQELLVNSRESGFQGSEHVFRTFDASNGTLKKLDRTPVISDNLFWMGTPSANYWGDRENLWATDRASGKRLWQVRTYGWSLVRPVVAEPLAILAVESSLPVELYAVDVRNGTVAWRNPIRCWSNPALSDNTIYAITESTALVGMDLRTGRDKGYITFDVIQAKDNTTYWVATAGNRVFAYFGDSRELIAFGP